jgi:hypothetical protein
MIGVSLKTQLFQIHMIGKEEITERQHQVLDQQLIMYNFYTVFSRFNFIFIFILFKTLGTGLGYFLYIDTSPPRVEGDKFYTETISLYSNIDRCIKFW